MEWYIILLRMMVALLVGASIGIDRELKNRPAGMRTHVLVCLGACIVALMESGMIYSVDNGGNPNITMNYGRLCAQVICGVGFLGAGTIMSSKGRIRGLTTAASLWNAACLGIATGYGYYTISIAGAVLVIVVLELMQKVVHIHVTKSVEVRFIHRVETIEYINQCFETHSIKVVNQDFCVTNAGAEQQVYTNTYILNLPVNISEADVVSYLSEYKNILNVRTSSFQS